MAVQYLSKLSCSGDLKQSTGDSSLWRLISPEVGPSCDSDWLRARLKESSFGPFGKKVESTNRSLGRVILFLLLFWEVTPLRSLSSEGSLLPRLACGGRRNSAQHV